ncbi:hypothetical protein RUM43_012381 [Polyplax serrata]|uniref:Leucine carboxyl methyltransferase 1 n=1 Tax=Polyplax serrata TaxID=468196 RepID=A0AAN8NKL1_POLSC
MERVSDEAVQATNDDASECKRCAVQLGYWIDPYIQFFVKATDRKAPEINRGYYARIMGVWSLLEKFLKTAGKECQIVNLGAGFDTLYWRLKDSGHIISNYVEVDFPTVTSRKCHFIKRNKQLLEKIHAEDGEIRLSATDLHASGFHIIGADLRNVKDLEAKLMDSDIKFDAPTFILAECVLVYMESHSGKVLLKFLSEKFSSAIFVNYEQVNIGDRFGEVMLKNLRARGCPLAGADACQSLSSQENRFLNNGWEKVKGYDMMKVYHALPVQDRQRIEQLELLDEQEILIQLFQHYCVVVAFKGTTLDTVDFT